RYDKLPEKNLRDLIIKAQTAESINNLPEAIRLVEAARAQKPEDIDLIRYLASIYHAQNNDAAALKVIKEALAANPTNHTLKRMSDQLTNPTTAPTRDEALAQSLEAIQQIPDPYRRELNLFRFYQG